VLYICILSNKFDLKQAIRVLHTRIVSELPLFCWGTVIIIIDHAQTFVHSSIRTLDPKILGQMLYDCAAGAQFFHHFITLV
jgi:hypothetical protein